jgi:SOS response regulatory protein OraA/RecX
MTKADSAYAEALAMLAQRDLSEQQVRHRLARRRHPPEAIDAAVGRLVEQGAINDLRTAEAIAHRELSVKRRGARRVRVELAKAGISPVLARRVTQDAARSVDPEAQIEASLAKRLRHRGFIANEAEFKRLFRYLIGQGFEPDQVLRALRSRAVRGDRDDQ